MNHHICISFQLVTVIVSCMYLTCMYCLKEPRDTSRKSRDRRSDVRADGDDDDRDAAAASTAAVDYDRHKRADVDKPSSTVAATEAEVDDRLSDRHRDERASSRRRADDRKDELFSDFSDDAAEKAPGKVRCRGGRAAHWGGAGGLFSDNVVHILTHV